MTTATTTKPSLASSPALGRGASAGAAPPPPAAMAEPEPSVGDALLGVAKDAVAQGADVFLTVTSTRPLYESTRSFWEGAARLWNGEPLADVALDAVIPPSARHMASLLGGVDAMKEGDELRGSVEVTGAFEGMAGRREVAVSIERSAHGYQVALEDALAVGALVAEKSGHIEAEAGLFGRDGLNLAVEVETADEAKQLAVFMAASGGTSALGAVGEGALLLHPGLREVELSTSILAEAGIEAPSSDELATLGLEGSSSGKAGAKFVAGDTPELVVSFGVELEDEAALGVALGGPYLGTAAGAEGTATRESHFALPPGTTPADLPGLLARGELFAQEPRTRWQVEGSVHGLDGNTLAIEGTLHVGEHGAAIAEGTVEWRSSFRPRLTAGELHHSTGVEGRLDAERSTLLRRVEFSSVQQLARALRSMQGELTRAL